MLTLPRRPKLAEQAHIVGLAHQFENMEQQQETASLGIWIFLATEIMFFGGLFAAYTIYRYFYYPSFAAGSRILSVQWGSLNTGVLLTSSFTMALSVRAAQMGKRRLLMALLVVTMLLGMGFLTIKGIEYHDKFVENVVPSLDFAPQGQILKDLTPGGLGHAEMFFFFYFAMTGVHAIHMMVGIGVLLVMFVKAYRRKLTPQYFSPLEVAGLYWHFVDIVWIFLFPLLYLIGGRY